MRLLDPRFRYVPAAATDVGATWRRFGFDARWNEKRREHLKQRIADEAQHDAADRSGQPITPPVNIGIHRRLR